MIVTLVRQAASAPKPSVNTDDSDCLDRLELKNEHRKKHLLKLGNVGFSTSTVVVVVILYHLAFLKYQFYILKFC